MSLLSLSVLQFNRTFLDTEKTAPGLDFVSRILIYLSGAGFLFSLTIWWLDTYIAVVRTTALILIIILILSIIQGMYLSIKKQRSAYFHAAAFLSPIIAGLLYGMQSFGVLPKTAYTNWSIPGGTIAFIVILSYAMADRINSMRKELKILFFRAPPRHHGIPRRHWKCHQYRDTGHVDRDTR